MRERVDGEGGRGWMECEGGARWRVSEEHGGK